MPEFNNPNNMEKTISNVIFCLIITLFVSCKDNELVNTDGLKRVDYTESDEIIINPERGFHYYTEYSSSRSNTLTVSSVLGQRRNNGISLILTIYYLQDFRATLISEEFLDRVRTNMEALRTGGSKCVLRFAYTSDAAENAKPWDAPKELVLQHIEQLMPILQEYSDVIYVMEAGFIGVWGEWYYTENFGMPADYASRREVLNALLHALPKTRMICLRTPDYKLKCFDISYADTITAATAYNQSDLSRLACHNDCFVASVNDVGTFRYNEEREFWQSETKYVVMGGETCGKSSYSTCENALLQMQNYHWSYLNISYHNAVLSQWKDEECYPEICKRLGYRFVLTEAHFSPEPQAGSTFEMKFKIKNAGWANLSNPRDAEIIFISKADKNEKYVFSLSEDPRFWSAGEITTVAVKFDLPSAMKSGEYDVYFNLPDPESTLRNRPEYSIRFANEGLWDEETGFNKIHTVKIEK